MNLISDPWIPVRRANGSVEKIAPWQITDGITDENRCIITPASPRPDFDGALVQFLIGILQTSCTPPDVFTWRKRRKEPPTPEELRARIDTFKGWFDLDGAQAFMQDLSPQELDSAPWNIERLLVGSPGDNAIEKNTDHFIKRESVKCLCPSCTATALYCLQVNGPAFGSGYREGLRRGGPVTTLLLGKTLWETCWLNILDESRYFAGFDRTRNKDSDRFPWLAKTRTSEAGPPAGITTTGDVHPDQQFWAMPGRIRLVAEDAEVGVSCDLCGERSDHSFCKFRIRKHGVLYQGFEHPLSPHQIDKNSVKKAIRTEPGGIGYRHWLGFLENNVSDNDQHCRARVVERFYSLGEDGRLWAFGYEIVPGQANVRCWHDSTMPILHLEGDQASILSAHVANMVKAARYVSRLVMSAVLKATMAKAGKKGEDIDWNWPRDFLGKLKRTPNERSDVIKFKVNTSEEELETRIQNGLLTRPMTARADFWATTEGVFFKRAGELRNVLLAGADESEVLRRWRSDLIETARLVFRNHTQVGDFDASDPRRAALAELELDYRMNGPRLRDLLGPPGRQPEAERRD